VNKVGGKFVLWLIIIGMLVFTAIRTVHFLQLTFPPDEQYVAYLGLAAFDVGVLAWFYFATSSAEGAAQRWVAYAMIAVCTGGVLATTVADMTIVSHENGLSRLPQDMGTLGLWAVIIVIVLNVAAGILAHLLDSAHQKHFEMQNAKDIIHTTTMQHIKQQAHTIAPQIAAQVSQYWASQVAAEMTGQIPGAQPLQIAPPSSSNVVQGSGVALPQTEPVQQQQNGVLARLKNVFVPAPIVPLPPTPEHDKWAQKMRDSASNVMSNSEQSSTPVQPDYDWLARQQIRMEREAKQEKALIDAARLRILAEEVRQQEQSPLQSPQVETGSQAGMNGTH
jgi:hypothetical protein